MQIQVHMTTTMWATLALAHPCPVLTCLLATSPCMPASLPPPFYPEHVCTSLAVLKQEDVHATNEDCHCCCHHGLPHMHRGHTSQTKSRSLKFAEDLLQAISTMFATNRVHPFSPLNTCPASYISTLGKSVQINVIAVATSGPNTHYRKPA